MAKVSKILKSYGVTTIHDLIQEVKASGDVQGILRRVLDVLRRISIDLNSGSPGKKVSNTAPSNKTVAIDAFSKISSCCSTTENTIRTHQHQPNLNDCESDDENVAKLNFVTQPKVVEITHQNQMKIKHCVIQIGIHLKLLLHNLVQV